MPFWVTNIIQINKIASYLMEWSQNLQQKRVLLQSVKGALSVHDQLVYRHQHCVTRKLDLDQTSMAYKHTGRHKCDKNWLFSQASWLFTPISDTFSIICCCYVCFGLLMQISLADYSAYLHELQVSGTLWSSLMSLDLYLGVFWISWSHYSLLNSLPPLNVKKNQ